METINLLQSFGITPDGRLVSVEDVDRGKACDCCCTECGEVLIARQGDVRCWHFAHESGTDCAGAAESALHKAAKQLILGSTSIMVPALEATETHRLDDGRLGEVSLAHQPEPWSLEEVREEVTVGDFRIDIAASHAGRPVFIEIAVTHPVDKAKQDALSKLGVHCLEILLNPGLHTSWTWGTLRQAVLDSTENRRWVFHPDLVQLQEQARCEAIAKAFAQPVKASDAPERIKMRLFGVPVHLVDHGWGLCLWWPYNEKVNGMLKEIAKSLGGRYRGAPYRNWVMSTGVKATLLEQLEGISAIREQ